MRRIEVLSTAFLLLPSFTPSIGKPQKGVHSVDNSLLEELIALERSALDRWIKLDPEGYFALYSSDITYFDPYTEKRVDGLDALQAQLEPMKTVKPPFHDPRYEILDPKVQRVDDVAVLTFNLVNYGKIQDQPESVLARWNSTEVYAQLHGKWKIVHSHWSYIKPQIKQP